MIALAGCGGRGIDGEVLRREITGLVTDLDGNPVRGARVQSGASVTFTGSSGAYSLNVLDDEFVEVTAEVTQDGVTYSGQNVASTFKDTLSQNVNIAVERIDRQGSIYGVVYDRFGREVANARVFAAGAGLSSAMTKTDRRGRYEISRLSSRLSYTVSASGFGYSAAFVEVRLRNGESRPIDFQLGQAVSTRVRPPANVTAVSWVSHFVTGRSIDAKHAQAVEAVKRLFDHRRASVPTRDRAILGMVEVDLYWDEIRSPDLLGFGVYRGSLQGATSATFLRDPLAGAFVDLDPELQENSAYGYRVTSLNTLFPEDQRNGESEPSELAEVRTLRKLTLFSVSDDPLTFRWSNLSGAEEFVVFVFDRFPAIGVTSIWNNADRPTASTDIRYTGPQLDPGSTYYYVVLGLANGQTARTVSDVGSFVAP